MDQGLFFVLFFVSYLFQTSCRYDSCIRLLHVIVLLFRVSYFHQETDQPDWRPEPEDVSYAEWVLDVTYYQRLEASARRLAEAGVEEPHKLRADIERKKTHGRALVAASPGNWCSSLPVHWCRRNCTCRSRKNAVELVWRLMMIVVLGRVLCVPAANKWMSIYAVAQDVALLLSFHNVLQHVEHKLHGKKVRGKLSTALPDDWFVLDSTIKRKAYTRKVASFMNDPLS